MPFEPQGIYMDQLCLFSSGVELADLMVSSGLLIHMWELILDTHRQSHDPLDSTFPFVKYKIYPHTPKGTVIAFVSSPEAAVRHLRTEGRDLISSEELRVFDFLGTKVNPCFSIHRTAVIVFYSLLDELTQLKNQYGKSSPLIITGHCLGGSIASLFTLWLLETISPTTSKRPLCITFGSPLLGNKPFQKAVSERPKWNSSFLHVISQKDPIPCIFTNSQIPHNCIYMPFGTYMILCSESGSASCFEEPESILELLVAVGSNPRNMLENLTEYGTILNQIMQKSMFKGVSIMDTNESLSNLQAGILMQLKAVGVETQANGVYPDSLATRTIEREKTLLTRKKNTFDPNKKLCNRKIDLVYLEWFKKASMIHGGYYDAYKKKQSGSREQSISKEEIRKRHKSLTSYWRKMAEEVEKMPQRKEASFNIRYLYAGLNYRRMVEPLDIADYYNRGRRHYVTQGRSQHYVLLEKWYDKDSWRMADAAKGRKSACYVTEDSCFWAHVEEAIISCKLLRDGRVDSGEMRQRIDDLVKFENYVMGLVNNYALSADVFLPESSFMQWWKEYYLIKGSSYESPLAVFMRNEYKNYA